MKLFIVQNYKEMSEVSSKFILSPLLENKNPVISLTTGASPAGLFDILVEAINSTHDVSNAVFLNVDEYVGPRNAVYTVNTFMQKRLYSRLNKLPKYMDMFCADAEDKEAEIKRYTQVLDTYPRDVQLLGLGTNGHIGACEPGTPFDQTAFCAKHKESTIQSTINLYGITRVEAPTEMYTMGFKEIMSAKTVLLIASGSSKAEAVRRMLEEPTSIDCPASYLLNHENFVFVIDADAAALLSPETKLCAQPL